jgi:hypothetical protein
VVSCGAALCGVVSPGGASAGAFLNPHARSRARARDPSPARPPQPRRQGLASPCAGAPRRRPASIARARGTNLAHVPGLLLEHMLALCWCTHLDAVGHPNLAVIGSAPTVVPAMVSTRHDSFSSSGMLLSCPSEPNGSHESRCGTCCPAAAILCRWRALPDHRSSGALHRTPGE